jgi:murein DD-endopeptidase MepM/ murein hydrolase activator NlpD
MTSSRVAAAVILAIWGAASAQAQDALVVSHRARAIQPGEVVDLTVHAPTAVTAVSATWRDRPVPFVREASGEWRALIGIDVAEAAGARALSVTGTRAGAPPLIASYPLTVLPKAVRTRRITVDPKFVNPPKSALPRIERETALLNALFRTASSERMWSGEAVRPVEGVAVSGFGVRSILNGEPRGPHNGLDLAAGAGTPIHAPIPGVVAYAREFYYSGNTVILDHGQGMFSTMAHLSAIDVKEGDHVATGVVLGKVGATGRVTGPHLHWAVRLLGARVDPLSLLAALAPAP